MLCLFQIFNLNQGNLNLQFLFLILFFPVFASWVGPEKKLHQHIWHIITYEVDMGNLLTVSCWFTPPTVTEECYNSLGVTVYSSLTAYLLLGVGQVYYNSAQTATCCGWNWCYKWGEVEPKQHSCRWAAEQGAETQHKEVWMGWGDQQSLSFCCIVFMLFKKISSSSFMVQGVFKVTR